MAKLGIKHNFITPYHPQVSNVLVCPMQPKQLFMPVLVLIVCLLQGEWQVPAVNHAENPGFLKLSQTRAK